MSKKCEERRVRSVAEIKNIVFLEKSRRSDDTCAWCFSLSLTDQTIDMSSDVKAPDRICEFHAKTLEK
jgi:hypothetical protein